MKRYIFWGVAVLLAAGLAGFMACASESEASVAEMKLPTIQCESCVAAVTKALNKVDGVQKVEIDLKAKKATVTYASNKATVPALEDAVVKAGYAANDKPADGDAYAKLPKCCKLPDAQ